MCAKLPRSPEASSHQSARPTVVLRRKVHCLVTAFYIEFHYKLPQVEFLGRNMTPAAAAGEARRRLREQAGLEGEADPTPKESVLEKKLCFGRGLGISTPPPQGRAEKPGWTEFF